MIKKELDTLKVALLMSRERDIKIGRQKNKIHLRIMATKVLLVL